MIVVLFSTTPRSDVDREDYQRASARMRELVATVPGFISYNTYRAEDGEAVAIVRFDSEEALEAWRAHPMPFRKACWGYPAVVWQPEVVA